MPRPCCRGRPRLLSLLPLPGLGFFPGEGGGFGLGQGLDGGVAGLGLGFPCLAGVLGVPGGFGAGGAGVGLRLGAGSLGLCLGGLGGRRRQLRGDPG